MGKMDGQRVRALRRIDGSNGPIEVGALGVVIAGPGVLSEIESWTAIGDTERAAAAKARASNPTFRGHPSRVVTVATENGWATYDLADLEEAPETPSAPALDPPALDPRANGSHPGPA